VRGPQLIGVDDDVALGAHVSKRLADVQARDPVGAPDLDTTLGFQLANDVLNEFPLSLINIRVELATLTVNRPDFARPKNFPKYWMHFDQVSSDLPTPQPCLNSAAYRIRTFQEDRADLHISDQGPDIVLDYERPPELTNRGAGITIAAAAGDVINLRGPDIDGGSSGAVRLRLAMLRPQRRFQDRVRSLRYLTRNRFRQTVREGRPAALHRYLRRI
jgi:hypothetical protein